MYRLKLWVWQTRKDGCKDVLGHKLQSADVIVRKWLRKKPNHGLIFGITWKAIDPTTVG